MIDEPSFGGGEPRGGPGLPLLHQVVYCSRAADGVDDAEVARIVATAQRCNPVHGITGLLVFGSGVFFQWIEGPRAHIEQLMALLHRDPRHRDIVALSETEEVRERLFPAWDMERVGAEDIRDVLQDALDNAEDPGHVAALGAMLERLEDAPLSGLGRA
jgi:hypothetical protein